MSIICSSTTVTSSPSPSQLTLDFKGFCSWEWLYGTDNEEIENPDCIVNTDIFGYCGMVIGILIGMAFVLIILMIVLICLFIVYKKRKSSKSKKKSSQRGSSHELQSTLKIEEIEMDTAIVEESPYQDPQSITRERAPTGEVYTIPQIRSPKKTGEKVDKDESLSPAPPVPPVNYTQLDLPKKESSTGGGGRDGKSLSSVVDGGDINEEKVEYSEIIV